MSLKKKYKKRTVAFLLVPVLVSVIIASNQYFAIQIIAGILLTLYVGFIIFLRDSLQSEEFDKIQEHLEEKPEPTEPKTKETSDNKYSFGDDGGFEIVAQGDTMVSDDGTIFDGVAITSETIEEYNKIINDFNKQDSNDFNFVLRLILRAIKDSLSVTSALFFIHNPEKEQITLHVAESNVPKKELIERKFSIENDVVSRIAKEKKPEILSNITSNVEADNIRYYSSPQGIKSFCGVPYDYDNQFTLILAVDSKGGNDFGPETTFILGRYIRVISMLISLFEENHSRKINDTRLNGLLSLIKIEKPFESIDEIATVFAIASENLINWDFFTFSAFVSKENAFKIIKAKTKNIPTKFVREGFEIDVNNSATGQAIKTGNHVYINDVNKKKLPRFSPNEKIQTDGSFLAIPLVLDGQNYGVVTFETLKKNFYQKEDIAFVKKAVKLFTYYIYNFINGAFVKTLVSLDPQTLVLNEKEFANRFDEMLRIELSCNKIGALVLIKTDSADETQSLFESKTMPKVQKKIAGIIKSSLKENSFVGKIDKDVFAVYFFDISQNDVRIWAEKTRATIAQTEISDSASQKRYTVSIGIATTETKDKSSILKNAKLALEKSIKSGGNKITV